jgi:hypothetical protein
MKGKPVINQVAKHGRDMTDTKEYYLRLKWDIFRSMNLVIS